MSIVNAVPCRIFRGISFKNVDLTCAGCAIPPPGKRPRVSNKVDERLYEERLKISHEFYDFQVLQCHRAEKVII